MVYSAVPESNNCWRRDVYIYYTFIQDVAVKIYNIESTDGNKMQQYTSSIFFCSVILWEILLRCE